MELDKRIKEDKRPLTCFDLKEAEQFIGKECYFSNCKVHYKNLSAFEKFVNLTDYCIGTLTAIMDLGDRVFDVDQQCTEFRYCLPCEWVEEKKEPKYRPYTLAEWVNSHEIGEVIRFRNTCNQEFNVMYLGYILDTNDDIQDTRTKGQIMFVSTPYTLQELFERYEICINGEWRPFGVLDDNK